MRNIRVVSADKLGEVPACVYGSNEPLLVKGLVSHWPLVKHALLSDEDFVGYLKQFSNQASVVFYEAEAEAKGRFFYNDDYNGFSFKSGYSQLPKVLDQLLANRQVGAAPSIYVGSTTVDKVLPGLNAENPLQMVPQEPLVSIWVGGSSKVAAHFDGPDNVACCVAGRRRFTLFPIEQVNNLYVGPLEPTPSGQPISLVDHSSPDFERFPRYREALDNAIVADMEPGDAIYVPSMWWHHVESMSDVNCLVNYWWKDQCIASENPLLALHQAFMCIRELPERERKAWRSLFDHYVFEDQSNKFDHIPEGARGFLNPLNSITLRQLRSWLLNKLNR